MSENEGFILKAEQFNQEEWCEMFRRVSETCKDLRNENNFLQTQLQQKENIIKEVREYIEHENFKRTILVGVSTKKYTRDILNNILEILDKEVN